ncbi:MAG TPA: hypothetical protein VF198_14525 [Vicinamibacterales bacterium]
MASAAARAALESLLRTRKLDTTLVGQDLPAIRLSPDRVLSTGAPALDSALGGGLPRGQVSEIAGPASSGRTALARALLASATGGGELAAIVDVFDRFDPAGAAGAGVCLDRLLWVRGESVWQDTPLALDPAWEPSRPGPRAARSRMGQAVNRAIKALSLVLSAGGFGLVVFDAADVPVRVLRQLPFTTWLRLQRAIEGSDTACVLLVREPIGRSPGGASVRLGSRTPAIRAVEQPADFHVRVQASRHPFVPGRPRVKPGRAGAAQWTGSPQARRFRGLAPLASVQCGIRTTSCELEFS